MADSIYTRFILTVQQGGMNANAYANHGWLKANITGMSNKNCMPHGWLKANKTGMSSKK